MNTSGSAGTNPQEQEMLREFVKANIKALHKFHRTSKNDKYKNCGHIYCVSARRILGDK